MDRDVTTRFCADAANLTLELSIYAGSDMHDEGANSLVRQLRVAAASILSACDAVRMSAMGSVMTPPPR